MADGRYFSTTKRGEIQEFKQELNAVDRGKRKDAVKKVIAAMTVGKDVSSLFPDVVNCMQTDDMELKKLVYLYLINYAKTQPDLAIMAVNTFVKDSQDPNPLIRALAVRTMGCIRVDRITEYLCDPLQRCLKDDDPYVRKTAAVCVAKLHDISPELVEDRGFLDTLRAMIGDANPMVVANAVAALSEIQDVSGHPVFELDSSSLTKLLRALNECTEWGQVFILDALAGYTPTDAKDAENIIERVMPRLQHANSAVVLSAIKVVLKNMEHLEDAEAHAALSKKLAPPLVTLLGSEPEIQYVALRCIDLVVQRYPTVLSHEVKVFFCKYNDPIYVKVEKLEIMCRLANEENIDQVLLEFKEYATEVDVDFVRRAVRAIGRCAISIEAAAERCVNVLLDLIRSRINYVVQESVVVIRDIFRRYPNKYESVIATLCENLESLDEPEAKAAMVWIVGEYAERIDNADELLEQFLESFPEETAAVQLQLVTAAVKLFLKRPTERPQQLIQLVLTYATQETDNPDLRDRAYIYWRLLSTDPEAAKDVVLAEKPVISGAQESIDPSLLDTLLSELGTLASVYHRPANSFVSKARLAVHKAEELEAARKAEQQLVDDGGLISTSDAVDHAPASAGPSQPQTPVVAVVTEQPATAKAASPKAAPPPPAPAPVQDLLGDLLSLDVPAPAAPVAPAAVTGGVVDLLGGLDLGAGGLEPAQPVAASTSPIAAPSSPLAGLDMGAPAGGGALDADIFAAPASPDMTTTTTTTLPVVLDADKGKGLVLHGALARKDGNLVYQFAIENKSLGAPADGFMVQFNKNTFGLAPVNQVVPITSVAPGATETADIILTQNPALVTPGASPALQIAIKTNQVGVLYLSDAVSMTALFTDDGRIASTEFVGSWKSIPDTDEQQHTVSATISDVEATKAKLEENRVFVMAHKSVNGEDVLYVTCRAAVPGAPVQLLLELRFIKGQSGVRLFYKSARADLAPLTFDAIGSILA